MNRKLTVAMAAVALALVGCCDDATSPQEVREDIAAVFVDTPQSDCEWEYENGWDDLAGVAASELPRDEWIADCVEEQIEIRQNNAEIEQQDDRDDCRELAAKMTFEDAGARHAWVDDCVAD